MKKNVEYRWDDFDPEAYFQHNYSQLRPEDILMAELTAKAFSQAGSVKTSLDVGTGSNLFPLLCALPRVEEITIWEYGAENIRWIKNQLNQGLEASSWSKFWDIISAVYESGMTVDEVGRNLKTAVGERIKQGSVFDLPTRNFDAATMFFCAESITTDIEEFQQACGMFVRSVKRGGLLVCLLYTSPSPRDQRGSRMPSSA